MTTPAHPIQISIVVPVGQRRSDVAALFAEYKAGVDVVGQPYEFIFVIDGYRPKTRAALETLQRQGEPITLINLTREFGEATALTAGFERARGDVVVTLPAYHQVLGSEIPKLIAALEGADMTVGRRWPRAGSRFEAIRRQAFHGAVGWITDIRFRDLGCGARAIRRRVLDEISLYGDQHRFLPVLANRQGFKVVEVDVAQSPHDKREEGYRAKEYLHRGLDLFTVLFLVRFTKKPLRFFGMMGATTFALGALLLAYLVVDRLFFAHALADRPALLLSSLLVVLGLQLFAIGLLGELIIFTHARDLKDYQVGEVIQFTDASTGEVSGSAGEARHTSLG